MSLSPSWLDPVRRSLPQRRLIRISLVTALIIVAAGLAYAAPSRSGCAASPATAAFTPTAVAPTAAPRHQPAESSAAPASTAAPAPPPGMIGVTVRVNDPAVITFLSVGSRIDLRTTDPPVAIDAALVLATAPGATFDEPGTAALLLALPTAQARRLLNQPAGLRYQVLVRAD